MSRNFLRNSVFVLAALYVAGLAPISLHATSTHATMSANGPGGKWGTVTILYPLAAMTASSVRYSCCWDREPRTRLARPER